MLDPLQAESASLAGLVRAITDLDGDFRLRLSSVEAAEVARS